MVEKRRHPPEAREQKVQLSPMVGDERLQTDAPANAMQMEEVLVDCSELPRTGGWFAAQIKPNGLALARKNLEIQGFPVFAPVRAAIRRGRGVRPTPLFPGYVFVQFDAGNAEWYRINSTRGVSGLLTGPTNRPRPLPDVFIETLQARCDADGVVIQGPDFVPGDKVRIVEGPFADIVSRVESLDPTGRLTLLMDLMGHAVRMSVPRNQTERLAEN